MQDSLLQRDKQVKKLGDASYIVQDNNGKSSCICCRGELGIKTVEGVSSKQIENAKIQTETDHSVWEIQFSTWALPYANISEN